MSTTLLKLLPKILSSRDQARSTANEAAQVHHDVTILTEERDKRLSQIADDYGGRIAALQKHFKSLVGSLEHWARGHRDAEWEPGKQTLSLDGNKLTFRHGTGKLEILRDGKALKDAEAVQAILATGDEALIAASLDVVPKPDKEGIKALITEPGNPLGERLRALGFVVTKEESFTFVPATLGDADSAA